MQFYSTKNPEHKADLQTAVLQGLADDGGLFMPENIPRLSDDFIKNLPNLSFPEIAYEISRRFFVEIPDEDLKSMTADAYNFPVPLVPFNDRHYLLELFHGPTLAFKDFGARFLARIASYFAKKLHKQITILVATSGDTGSAVAQGFLNAEGVRVYLLYPSGKVSKIQEKQLTTIGYNITALEIQGVFDDCQRLVKEAFVDPDLKEKFHLTSANSINIARLLPQTFYYFYAYSQIPDHSKPLVISVPSGNFGNLTAGLIAKKMGLPIDHFIASTNANDIIPKYLKTGKFEPKASVSTISNAMDVGNPNNFPRILDLYDHDLEKIRKDISGFSFSDDQTRQAIRELSEKYSYTIDPHGAVAYLGLEEFLKSNPDHQGIIFETAHASKFLDIVEPVLNQKIEIPERLKNCLEKEKKTVLLPPDFIELKNFLLNN